MKRNNVLYSIVLFVLMNSLCGALILLPKIDSIISLATGEVNHISNNLALCFLVGYGVLLLLISYIQKVIDPSLNNVTYLSVMCSCLLALFGGLYSDIWFLFNLAQHENNYQLVLNNLDIYLDQSFSFYGLILVIMGVMSILFKIVFKINFEKTNDKAIQVFFVIMALILAVVSIVPLPAMNIALFKYFRGSNYYPLPVNLLLCLNVIYTAFSLSLLIIAFRIRKKTKEQLAFLLKLVNVIGFFSGFALVYEAVMVIYPYKLLAEQGFIDGRKILYYGGLDIKNYWAVLGILLVFTLALTMFRKYIKKVQFDDIHNDDNAGTDHGGGKFATQENITDYGFHLAMGKLYCGKDEKGNRLYLPISNRTLLAPPGGGKTTTVAIPLALSYNGPMVLLDLKAELWAVAARYRFEKFGRKQIAIDPFNITQQKEFQYKGDLSKKPDELLFKYRINPFHEIPEDPSLRQRVLSAFASSFIVREDAGGSAAHFYDNAEILIKGLIDYILKSFPRENQNFAALLDLFQIPAEQLPLLLEGMMELGGEAANAAGTLSKLGDDERGGIFSTAGRQLSWLTDINMQDLLSDTNFSIDEVIDGNADIYIILPADVVQSHGRLIRMIISLVRGSLIRHKPSELPEDKIVFLMDEIAQLGKCPDIEQAIEIFRSYGVVVWAIFQFLSQIEKFDKPDVFTNATTLQFFTNKDNDTMKFIQDKLGKTTILQKTLSNNKGDQRQKNQVWGGSVSIGEGESINSGGVDLVHFDQIREMPKNEQWFLYDNLRPIKAQKIPYYADDYFNGRFDPNPIEDRNFARKIKKHVESLHDENQASNQENQAQVKSITPETTTEAIPAEATALIGSAEVIESAASHQSPTTEPVSKTVPHAEDIQHISHIPEPLSAEVIEQSEISQPDMADFMPEIDDMPDFDDLIDVEEPEKF